MSTYWKVTYINNERTTNIENKCTDIETTIDLEVSGNNNTNETETYVIMEAETELQNGKKII